MKKIIIVSVSFVMSCFAVTALAGTTVAVPNTFVSGQTATAASVNDNFTTLKNGINSNTITVYRNDDTVLGTLLSKSNSYQIMSDDYYSFTLYNDGTLYGYIYFDSNDCSGTPYVQSTQSVNRIVDTGNVGVYYYAPKQGNYLNFTPQSFKSSFTEGCQVQAGFPSLYYEAMVNDVGVTGVRSELVGSGFYIGGRQ